MTFKRIQSMPRRTYFDQRGGVDEKGHAACNNTGKLLYLRRNGILR